MSKKSSVVKDEDNSKVIIKEGYLSKRGENGVSGWQKRYVRIWSNKIVEYFVDNSLKDKKGVIDLNGIDDNNNNHVNEIADIHRIEFGFKIITTQRTWYFAASNNNEREEWIKVIRDVIKKKTSIETKKKLNNKNNIDIYDNNYILNNSNTINLEDLQRQEQELEYKTNNALDNALQLTINTETIAIDTSDKLHTQRKQLEHIDQTLHEIDNQLTYSDHILIGMKNVGGMIHNMFVSKPNNQTYVKPDTSNVQANERNNNLKDNNNNKSSTATVQQIQIQTQTQKQKHQSKTSETDERLDEILKGIRRIHAIANDINQELDEQDVIISNIDDKIDKVGDKLKKQSRTMQKLT